jgi:rapamycin-insensitive companion of mTOR
LTGSHFPDAMEILNLSTRALTVMLKTWPGLLWAARNGAASALVSALEHQDSRVVAVVLDSLFEIFRVPQVGSANPFQKHDPVVLQADDADSVTGPASLNLSSGDSSTERTRNSRKQNVINNYLSVLLLTFIDVGLIEALTNLGSSSEVDVDRIKVTMLLAELLYLSNILLPPSLCSRIQQTPVLVKKAVSFRLDAQLRSRASTMVTNLHKYTNLKASHQEVLLQGGSGPGAANARRIRDFRLARIDEVRRKIDWDIDDQTLLQMLRQTQVTQLGTKDWSRWKWDSIVELLDGPLCNPALLSSSFMKSGSTLANAFSKFLKRLLSFYRPSKKLFSELSWQYENMVYVRAGTALLELLTESDGGREFLTNHHLLKNLSDVLAAEVLKKEGAAGAAGSTGSGAAAAANAATAAAAAAAAQSGIPAGFFWSHERMLRTMAREYFPLLGVLTRSTTGLSILNNFGIMARLRSLCEKSNRDDLVHLILTSLDYDQKSDCISILHVGITNPKSPVVRYLATRHMRHLLRQRSADFENWGIEFLHERVTLPDPEPKVRNLALQILDEACDDEQAMLKLISSKAMLYNEQLGGAGRALQIRFLSLPQGFQYLQEIGWVHTELEKWVATENAAYVEAIEKKISGVLNRPLNRRVTGADGPSFLSTYNTDDEVFIVPHFFGELAKTSEGCKFIKRSNIVPKFVKLLTKTAAASGHAASSLERRAAMWALGHISCSSTGFELLEPQNVTQVMVDLAENASSLSIRGTAIYVLGMMSAAAQVRDKLQSLGWECPVDISGTSGRLALPIQGITSKMFLVDADDVNPVRFSDIFGRVMWALPEKGPAASVSRAYSSSSSSSSSSEAGAAPSSPVKDQESIDLRSEILTNVANLSNHVSAEPAQRTLRRIKAKNPDAFADPILVFEVFKILEHLTFRLKQRRFLGELFDDVSWTDDAFKTIEKLFPSSQLNSSSLYR